MRQNISIRLTETDIKEIKSSARYKNIVKTQKLAMKHNRCKELFNDKCSYPHCGCLYGANAHINPITGKEYLSCTFSS